MRAHSIGGPACRIMRSPIPGSASSRATPMPTSTGCAASSRRPGRCVGGFHRADGRVSRASAAPAARSPTAGGAHSTLRRRAAALADGVGEGAQPDVEDRQRPGKERAHRAFGPAIAAASRTACALLAARSTPACAQGRFLPLEALRIAAPCRRRSRRRRAAALPAGGVARLAEHRCDLGGRDRVGAVAEHDVEQDHRHLGVGGLREHALVAQAMVDHRVRPAAREYVVAEVDQRMAARPVHVRDAQARIQACASLSLPCRGRQSVPQPDESGSFRGLGYL